MKKPLAVLLSVFLFVQTTIAQRNDVDDIDRENFFRIGAKGGVNINKISGSSYNQAFNFNYQIGGFMQFNFSKRFGIQPEVNFVQSTSTNTNDLSDVSEDLFYGGPQKNAKFNYLEIPVLLNINAGETRHVKFQMGPSVGAPLKGIPETEITENIQHKDVEVSAIGGLWIQLPFINLGGRYQYGINKVYGATAKQSAHNQAIEVFTGFTF